VDRIDSDRYTEQLVAGLTAEPDVLGSRDRRANE
jgi:hypothetical protein